MTFYKELRYPEISLYYFLHNGWAYFFDPMMYTMGYRSGVNPSLKPENLMPPSLERAKVMFLFCSNSCNLANNSTVCLICLLVAVSTKIWHLKLLDDFDILTVVYELKFQKKFNGQSSQILPEGTQF